MSSQEAHLSRAGLSRDLPAPLPSLGLDAPGSKPYEHNMLAFGFILFAFPNKKILI
jgi:hypothetical protein